MPKNPIILPLDVSDRDTALRLVETVSGSVGAVKIGKELFVTAGPDIVREIRGTGAAVFLDLKFHDIPNTVAKAVAASTRLDVQMLTIHTSGAGTMMAAAEKAAQETAQELGQEPPLVLGVTVLTSMDGEDLQEIGVTVSPQEQVERLAKLAADSGLRGLVCSPLEIERLRGLLPSHVQLVTPGIRPAGSAAGDQKRIMTPKDAIAAGADWLVIGRPISQADDPKAAAESILESL
ncbi:MAG: orotidine-5'-phosphate decarboxylase [Limisphaerales bacterium]